MREDDYLAPEINHLREAVEAQTAGLVQMLKIQAQQSAMLKEILAACTAPESDEPSPLVKLIMTLHEGVTAQSAAIGRIEAAVVHPART
jgi:hypothetical protein